MIKSNSIEIINLSFFWNKKDKIGKIEKVRDRDREENIVLKNVNLNIKKGNLVVIIGG